MNIIIPLGGKGERFSNAGYTQPKALIPVFTRTLLSQLLDNIQHSADDNVIIIYNPILDNYGFNEYCKKNYSYIHLVKLHEATRGPTETIHLGLKQLPQNVLHKKTILLDSDTFYTKDIIGEFRSSQCNIIYYVDRANENPIYSYIEMDDTYNVLNIAEKTRISPHANTGAYAFNDTETLLHYCEYVIHNNITHNNEFYTSCVIKEMLKDGEIFSGHKLSSDEVYSLGTPTELQEYIDRTVVFLFDLDGTLVKTDDIYYDVWKTILIKYGLTLTHDIYTRYIRGNNDTYVASILLPTVNVDLRQLSSTKDDLFIQQISKIILIKGVHNMFKAIKSLGHKISIVTNSNRRVAEVITQFIDVNKYIDFIITCTDCTQGKPHPEPYLKAMETYGVSNNKTLIFEDSKSGILSAQSVRPKCLIGITTNYNSVVLRQLKVDIVIDDYHNCDINGMINFISSTTMDTLTHNVHDSMQIDLLDIHIDQTKLKGGFISDVVGLTVKDSYYVLKIESQGHTMLSEMATQLELYQREYYFYETISKYVNIRIPRFYGLIKDRNMRNVGIMMENLNMTGNYFLNLDLNETHIEVSLKIIDQMAKLHAKYWNRTLLNCFDKLKTPLSHCFRPFCSDFIDNKWNIFVEKWSHVLSTKQLQIGEMIKNNFSHIQLYMAQKNVTLVHGDIKSPNIFYDKDKDYEPVFIDWQHVAIGKGVQDLIFFIIESFDLANVRQLYSLFKGYYYRKLMEHKIIYAYSDFETDLSYALCYIPFFTAVWFGTVPYDELIDKNFPYFFLQKLFYILEDIKPVLSNCIV